MIRSTRRPRCALLAFVLAAVPGTAAPAFAGEPPAPRSGGARPAPSATQQQNLARLKADLAAIKAGSTVTPAQKQALARSLQACVQGATKPSAAAVEALAASVAAAVADHSLTPKEKAAIAAALQGVLAGAGVPASEVEALIEAAQAALTAAGLSKETAQAIARDLQTIATELAKNASAAKAAKSARKSAAP